MGVFGFKNRWAQGFLSIFGLCILALAAGGCQNALYEENVKLRQENRELQARLTDRDRMRAQDAPITPPPPEAPKATEPRAFVPPTPTPPVPAAPAPSEPPDLGGEVTVDPATGYTTVNFLGDALFDSGKAVIKATAKANLDKCAAALKKQYAGKTVKVQGHSDSDPIKRSAWKSNQELSEARAKAVRDYLVSKGVPAGNITAEGFGDTKPKSATDKSKNRRVEIVVLTK